jgi:hypothetical protein
MARDLKLTEDEKKKVNQAQTKNQKDREVVERMLKE